MAKITRIFQKIFGNSPTGANQTSVIGSLAAAAPAFTTNPLTMQSLANFDQGLQSVVVGSNSPAIEDVNSLFYLFTYQLAYLMQAGTAEWDATTTYYKGSLVTIAGDISGHTYSSQVDTNLNNNPATDTTNWKQANAATFDSFLSDSTWTCPTGVTKVRVSVYSYLYTQLGGGVSYAGAINSAGSAYAWGLNDQGQLGNGDVNPRSSPVLVLGNLRWRNLGGGGGANKWLLGAANNGDAYAWGFNGSGQLGLGDVTPRSSPALVLGGLKWRQVSTGGSGSPGGTSIGIAASGDAYCWGYNGSGQLGLGDVTPRSSPVIVLGGHKWRYVDASSQCIGIDSNGDAYAWGSNFAGQLGVGDVVPRSSPVLVLGGLKFAKVVTDHAGSACFGITDGNLLYAWGNNADGGLGVGDVIPRSSPVLVLGGLQWKEVSTFSGATVGITTGGDAYGWGRNLSGGLGLGDVTPRSSPVLVLGGRKWLRAYTYGATAGPSTSFIASTALLYAAGGNASGQLGDGTVVPKSSPVLVLGGLNWPTVFETLVNTNVVSVTAGQTYDVLVYGLVALFNYRGLYQDPYASGALPTKVVIEYET